MTALELIIYQILIGTMMILSMFFSGVETAIISADPFKLNSMIDRGNRRAERAMRIIARIDEAISMVLIGNNIVNISSAALITYILTKMLIHNDAGIILATVIQTIVFLVVCELTPKIIARSKAEKFLMTFSLPVQLMMTIMKPLVSATLYFTDSLKKKYNLTEQGSSLVVSKDEIGFLFKRSVDDGIIDKDHHDFINEFLSFNEVTAHEVMTPLIDIVSVENRQSVRQLVKIIDRTKFSRIPVYEGRVDNIIGYVNFHDLMENSGVGKIGDILNKPAFVPSTKNIHELYHEMQANEVDIVFVVSEFGSVEGLLTNEDIAEEIVGEIQTRDHPDSFIIKKIAENKYLLSGNIDIDYIQRRFGILFKKKGFETLAGFVNYHMGRIPAKGEKFEYGGFIFNIEETTDRSVEKLVINKIVKKR
jgi:putative hemolysin